MRVVGFGAGRRGPVRRRIAALGVATATLAVGACDRGADDAPRANDPSTASSTTSTVPRASDPSFAVPPTIDAAYVERVLAELDRVQGDVVRRIAETGAFAGGDVTPLRAIFLDPELRAQTEGFRGLVQSRDRLRRPPGDNRSTVVRLVTARPECIYAETTVDVSATVVDPPPPFTSYVALRPTRPGDDPQDLNRTPYAIAAEHPDERDPCG